MKEWSEIFEERFRRSLIAGTIGTFEKVELTRRQKFKFRVNKLLSYLTRYQIVDTWKIHDDCY